MDQPPAEVYARLLDEDNTYLCSTRTMYRILASAKEVRERRNLLRHPNYAPPQLLATAPNQVWSWDIERHEALTNLAVVKGHCVWRVAARQMKLRAAGAGERR
jgi:putative transposase